MSAYDYVFIAPVHPVMEADLVTDLERVLSTRFVRQPSDYATYLATAPGLALDLGTHDFENDRDMAFEEFPYVITVRKVGQDADFQLAAARRIVDALKATGRYRLLLVAELQRTLDEFSPQTAPTRNRE